MTETLRPCDGRHVLLMERWFPHPVEKVWRAITRAEEMRHWFPAQVDADPSADGTLHFVFEHGEANAMEGTVLEFEPPRLCRYTWGDSILRFELRPEAGPEGAGCRMVFSHTFDGVVSAASYAAGWHICFENLYLFVDDRAADVGLDQWAALHDGFVERFGLDEGTIEHRPGGDVVIRFERQLTKPVEPVWATLAAGRPVAAGGPVPPAFTRASEGGPTAAPGVVCVADPPRLLEFVAGASRVRWELAPGNGGAVVILTDTVVDTAPGQGATRALAAWADRLSDLALRLREPAAAQPFEPS